MIGPKVIFPIVGRPVPFEGVPIWFDAQMPEKTMRPFKNGHIVRSAEDVALMAAEMGITIEGIRV
jgi:hypothetical protein